MPTTHPERYDGTGVDPFCHVRFRSRSQWCLSAARTSHRSRQKLRLARFYGTPRGPLQDWVAQRLRFRLLHVLCSKDKKGFALLTRLWFSNAASSERSFASTLRSTCHYNNIWLKFFCQLPKIRWVCPKMGWFLTTFSLLGMHPARPIASFVPTADFLPFPDGKEYGQACFRLDGTCFCHYVNQVGERSRKSQVRDCPKTIAQPTKSGLSLAQRILLRRGTFVQADAVWMAGSGQAA